MVFGAIRRGLSKTRKMLSTGLRTLMGRGPLTAESIEEIEELLLQADFGPAATQRLVDALEDDRAAKRLPDTDPDALIARLRHHIGAILQADQVGLARADAGPTVVLVSGVNGVGKTTSIAKLARHLSQDLGHRVVLAACDTFRAAAVEQLETWAGRTGVELVKGAHEADPASVAFEAVDRALEANADYLIVDTAGRLHTREPLMQELGKIFRILGKKIPGAPHEALLVLDATVGQNGLQQASAFGEVVNVTGIFLAKLDGTAKGGIAVAICETLDIPIKFVGTGEQAEDMAPFDPERFIDGLLGEPAGPRGDDDAGPPA
ncbi:MAG: signal recognition particle-docking protein FtsY [Planctomycetota bacterium]